MGIEKEVSSQQLDKTSVDQDTSGNSIKDAGDDVRGERARVIRRADAEANGNCDGSRKAVGRTQEPGEPAALLEGDGGETGADTEALEGLVEDEDGVEGREFIASNAEVEADNDRVEDDAELKDEEGGDLLPEAALDLDVVGLRLDLLHLLILGPRPRALRGSPLRLDTAGHHGLWVFAAHAVFHFDVALGAEV